MSDPLTPPGRGYIAVDLGDGTAWVQRPDIQAATETPLADWEKAIIRQAAELDRLRTDRAPLLAELEQLGATNAAAVQHVTRLEAERDATRARHAAALAVLRSVEWQEDSTDPESHCPCCGGAEPLAYNLLPNPGHKPDCPLARVLAPEQTP